MVTFGVDCHKKTHTIVGVDEVGREVSRRTVAASPEGHLEAVCWAAGWQSRRWALEDCRHVSGQLERDLLVAGEAVVRVSPRLMASSRRSGRERGKSDPIDALAVARVGLREPDLPVARLEGRSRELRLLVDHREDLVGERTRAISRLRWRLHELAPGYQIRPRALTRRRSWAAVEQLLESHQGLLAELAAALLSRIQSLSAEISGLDKRITTLTEELAPSLLELHGCGSLTAAKIVGETGEVSRFRSSASFALNNGTAPIPASSGNQQRVRLNRGGNRQLNAALHRIAITQIRTGSLGRAYFAKQLGAGHTQKEALRSLRRRLSDEVYRRLLADRGLISATSVNVA
jgi:transposase